MFGSELKELKDLLSRMLIKDSGKRLKTLKEVKSHPWFSKHINLTEIETKSLTAPFVPSVRTEDDKLFAQPRSAGVEAIAHLFL